MARAIWVPMTITFACPYFPQRRLGPMSEWPTIRKLFVNTSPSGRTYSCTSH